MKKTYWISVCAALFISLVFTLSPPNVEAQDPSAMPGPAHKQLASLAGEYTTVTKFFAQPGAAPMESTGIAKITVILDGRFLQEEDAGDFLGQPVKSTRLWGFDNGSKQYQAIWVYTGSTGIMNLTGNSNDGGKTVKLVATFNDGTGGKQTLDASIRQIDAARFVVGLYAKNPDGSQGPTFETTYTRKK